MTDYQADNTRIILLGGETWRNFEPGSKEDAVRGTRVELRSTYLIKKLMGSNDEKQNNGIVPADANSFA